MRPSPSRREKMSQKWSKFYWKHFFLDFIQILWFNSALYGPIELVSCVVRYLFCLGNSFLLLKPTTYFDKNNMWFGYIALQILHTFFPFRTCSLTQIRNHFNTNVKSVFHSNFHLLWDQQRFYRQRRIRN